MALKFAVNNSLSAVTSLPTAIPTGSMTLLQTQTASSSSTIDFTSNIDSTYDVYCFKFINIHPANDNVNFLFNGSDDDSSHSYDITKTTTFFRAHHNEADSSTALGYRTGQDLAQSTSFQQLNLEVGNDNDQSLSGYLHLYNPSSTTFVKHFIARTHVYFEGDYAMDGYVSGYFNTTADITAIQFKMSSGNIDSGDIKLYGIS